MIIHHLPSLKKEPCDCPCTSIPRILGLRTSHESSSPPLRMRFLNSTIQILATLTHNIPTSEPQVGGYPQSPFTKLPLSLNHLTIFPENAQVLISFIIFLLLLQEFLAMFYLMTLVQLHFHQKLFLDFLQNPSF